jgi:hypothetical protein
MTSMVNTKPAPFPLLGSPSPDDLGTFVTAAELISKAVKEGRHIESVLGDMFRTLRNLLNGEEELTENE